MEISHIFQDISAYMKDLPKGILGLSGQHCPGTPRSVLERCSPGHCRSTAYKRYNERRCICGDCANRLAGLVSGGMFPVIWRSAMFSRILRIHVPATTDDTGHCGHSSNVSKNVGFKHRLAHLVICCRRFYDETFPPFYICRRETRA